MITGIRSILKTITPIIWRILLAFVAITCLAEQYSWALSAIVGTLFSYIGFSQLASTQNTLLSGKLNKGALFVRYLLRLSLYTLPIMLGIYYHSYFNIGVILIFLFIFQLGFISHEFIRNIKHYKKRSEFS